MNLRTQTPLGLEVTASAGTPLDALDIPQLKAWIAEHRVAVLRGFADPPQEQMLAFCRQLGEILEWEFGSVNELQARPDSPNYLYTNRDVPFHWDGAFVDQVPHYIFFHCRQAPPPGSGGETTFCDTVKLLRQIPPAMREEWSKLRITYSTDRVVHYGGSFTSPLLARHPVSGDEVLRFAEPVADLNPVRLAINGLPAAKHDEFLAEMHRLLNDPAVCYAHEWREGDVVLADNHALLHGRRAYTQAAPRHLRRVNIL